MLPLLVWGTLTTEEKFIERAESKGESTEFPTSPGVFALNAPYETTVIVVSENCPARYVNDSKGLNASPNIQFVQHKDPRELYYNSMKGMHLLLQAQALRDIEPAAASGVLWQGKPINRPQIDVLALADPGPESSFDIEEDTPITLTPVLSSTPVSKSKSSSALSQHTPVTPIDCDLTNDVDDFVLTSDRRRSKSTASTSSQEKKTKPVTKSGGGKEIDLDELPQTSPAPGSGGKRSKSKKTATTSEEQSERFQRKQVRKRLASTSAEELHETDERESLLAAETLSKAASPERKVPTLKKASGYIFFFLDICCVLMVV